MSHCLPRITGLHRSTVVASTGLRSTGQWIPWLPQPRGPVASGQFKGIPTLLRSSRFAPPFPVCLTRPSPLPLYLKRTLLSRPPLSTLTLPYPTLPCSILPLVYPSLAFPTLPYPILSYPILSYPTLPYPTLIYPTLPFPF